MNSNVLHSLGPAPAGSVFTSVDGNMYVQVEGHLESEDLVDCKFTQWSFDNSLSLLQVKPSGEADWKTFQHIHADGNGSFHLQPRVFVGESIPDGQDGVLTAWTYFFPGSKEKNGEKSHFEARLSRIGPLGQFDYTLPMALWTPGINSLFDENMILAENNVALYATNKHFLLRFEIKPGEVKWVRNPPTGEVDLQFSTPGGGLMVTNSKPAHVFRCPGKCHRPSLHCARFEPKGHWPGASSSSRPHSSAAPPTPRNRFSRCRLLLRSRRRPTLWPRLSSYVHSPLALAASPPSHIPSTMPLPSSRPTKQPRPLPSAAPCSERRSYP